MKVVRKKEGIILFRHVKRIGVETWTRKIIDWILLEKDTCKDL